MSRLYKTAFTLIELLVVIAIIGILSGLIVVGMNGMTNSANVAKAQVFSNSLRNALMLNLVSEWKFDGNANDSWSGGNNGTWNGAGGGTNTSANYRPTTECVSGQCLNFDGTDDYVDCGAGSNINITGNLTISAWVNPVLISGSYRNIVGNSYETGTLGGYTFYIHSNNLLRGAIHLGSDQSQVLTATSSGATFSLSAWQHVAMVFNGTNLMLYKNGSLVGISSTIPQDTIATSAYTVKIGRMGYVSNYFFNGTIDEVRIFNAAMPTSQIKEQYYSGLNNLFGKGKITREEYIKLLASK